MRADRILPPAEEAVAQSSCLGRLIRTHVKVSSGGNRDEFAVIGLGRFGSSLARTLVSRGASVLGIDRSPEPVQELADELTQTVVLDATNETALREVDITAFGTVIVAIGSNFEANLLTTVALRELGCTTSSARR